VERRETFSQLRNGRFQAIEITEEENVAVQNDICRLWNLEHTGGTLVPQTSGFHWSINEDAPFTEGIGTLNRNDAGDENRPRHELMTTHISDANDDDFDMYVSLSTLLASTRWNGGGRRWCGTVSDGDLDVVYGCADGDTCTSIRDYVNEDGDFNDNNVVRPGNVETLWDNLPGICVQQHNDAQNSLGAIVPLNRQGENNFIFQPSNEPGDPDACEFAAAARPINNGGGGGGGGGGPTSSSEKQGGGPIVAALVVTTLAVMLQ
jgi:hypothetical protein